MSRKELGGVKPGLKVVHLAPTPAAAMMKSLTFASLSWCWWSPHLEALPSYCCCSSLSSPPCSVLLVQPSSAQQQSTQAVWTDYAFRQFHCLTCFKACRCRVPRSPSASCRLCRLPLRWRADPGNLFSWLCVNTAQLPASSPWNSISFLIVFKLPAFV